MIVCICHYVSDRDIEREARQGCASFEALQQELSVATACGSCDSCARKTFERACAGAAGHGHATHHAAAVQAVHPLRWQSPVFAPVQASAA